MVAGQNRVAGTDFSSKSMIWTTRWPACGGPAWIFRGDMISGKGGRQALIADPAGNLVELFEPSD